MSIIATVDSSHLSKSKQKPRSGAACPKWPPPAVWQAPREIISWAGAQEWDDLFWATQAAAAAEVQEELAVWDRRLALFGGDPSRQDWLAFRPLRLSREEDWSDWLAHLLERAETGRFPACLLGAGAEEADRWRVTRAYREVSASGYRADLLVHFQDGSATQIEVKVGDLSLGKIVGTGLALRDSNRSLKFRDKDYLLLPQSDRAQWDNDKSDIPDADRLEIEVLTWEDVARSLRQSLLDEQESVTWRAFGIAFLGAVEQRILGFQQIDSRVSHRRPSSTERARLELLKEASA